jgi:hypothetical protein
MSKQNRHKNLLGLSKKKVSPGGEEKEQQQRQHSQALRTYVGREAALAGEKKQGQKSRNVVF